MSFSLFINFDGNCKEAVDFYARVFKTEVEGLMTFGQMPGEPDPHFLEEDRDRVMYCSVDIAGTNVMFSDVPSWMSLERGNDISVVVGLDDADEVRRLYEELKEGGNVNMELQKTFWSELYAMFTDKFGVNWQLSLEEKAE